jgi:heat shock protein HslJ
MPERWERRLQALAEVQAPPSIDRRLEEGPRGHDAGPTTKGRVAAALVAFAVFAAAGAFAWRAFDGDPARTLSAAPDKPPTLSIGLQSAGFVEDMPEDEDPWLQVDAVIDYGDLHVEEETSTTPTGAIVEWVHVEDLTPLVPGPVVGSPVAITSDGGDARVMIGDPVDWPNFDRFERIDALPTEQGDYVLIFAADYAEGMAMTARAVTLVPPGTVQLTVEEGGSPDAATASASVDGAMVEGFLSTSWFMGGDLGGQSEPRSPSFENVPRLEIVEGARIVLSTPADAATAGLFADGMAAPDRLPTDLMEGTWEPSEPPGSYDLVVEATWRHGKTGWAQTGTKERARFVFPVEIVGPEESTSTPPTSVESSPTEPAPATTGSPVAGSTWQLTAIDGNPVPQLRRPITVIFSDDNVSGFDGCNTYGGKYQLRDGSIDADEIVSTAIGCEGEIMARSEAMFDRLIDANVMIEGTALTLSTDAGTATFDRLDVEIPDDPAAALDCAPEDRVPVAPHAKDILDPAPPSYISVNLSGVPRSELVQVAGSEDPALPSTWSVIRDGQVIGVIEVPTLDGTACRGSGIEGV